jgi:alpha-1,6-mannosyltransferase
VSRPPAGSGSPTGSEPDGALRVAQLANYVGPKSGGLGVVVDELGREHVRRGGRRLTIVPAPSASVVTGPGQRLVSVAAPALPASGGAYHVLYGRRVVTRELDRFAPHLLEVHDQTTLAWTATWARRAGVPSMLFSHERFDLVAAQLCGAEPERFERLGRRWAGWLATRFDVVVCASQFAAGPFRAAGADNVVRIPFGVDLETFSPAPRGQAAAWRPRVVRLVFVGRLWPEKAPDVALDVLARLIAGGLPAQLVLLGGGPLESDLRARARAERLPVHFAGHLAGRHQVAELLATADVALAPGPRETFGLGVLEAMASGTPVVVSGVGAAGELLAPGAGIAALSAEAMAHGVRALLADPASGRRARLRAEEFSWRATSDALAAAGRDLLAGQPGQPGQPAGRRRPRLVSNRSSRSRTSIAAQTRLRPPPDTSVSTSASTSRSTAR